MSEELINLLPEDLRDKELNELKRPSIASESSDFSKPLNLDQEQLETVVPPVPKVLIKPAIENKFTTQIKSTIATAEKLTPQSNSNLNKELKNQITVKPVRKSEFWPKLFSWWPKSKTTALDQAALQTNGTLSFDVNLVPSTAYYTSSKILKLKIILGCLVALFLLSLIHLGLVFVIKLSDQQLMLLQVQILANQKKINDFQVLAGQLNQLEKQSQSINGLIGQHIYWTQFLKFLEGITLPTVYYNSMSALPSGQVNLQVAAPTYAEAVQQITLWQHESKITKINFGGMSANADSGGVGFSAKLDLDPSIFYKK